MTVTKKDAVVYHVRAETNQSAWASIVIINDDKKTTVMVASDYGDFSNTFSTQGLEHKEFLCSLDFDYAMGKMAGEQMYVYDSAACRESVKASVADAFENEMLSEEDANSACSEMLAECDLHQNPDILAFVLSEHEFAEEVFGNEYPDTKKLNPHVVSFWNELWVPFTVELNKEIKGGQ